MSVGTNCFVSVAWNCGKILTLLISGRFCMVWWYHCWLCWLNCLSKKRSKCHLTFKISWTHILVCNDVMVTQQYQYYINICRAEISKAELDKVMVYLNTYTYTHTCVCVGDDDRIAGGWLWACFSHPALPPCVYLSHLPISAYLYFLFLCLWLVKLKGVVCVCIQCGWCMRVDLVTSDCPCLVSLDWRKTHVSKRKCWCSLFFCLTVQRS